MREFIEKMKSAGLAETITQKVSADCQAAELAYRAKKMLIFENLDGHKCVMNTIYNRKSLSQLLGIKENEIVKTLSKADCSGKTKIIGDLKFEKPDLSKIPILKHFPGDAGKYITAGIVFSEYDGITNASIHRMLVLDSTHLAARIVEGRHTDKLMKKAFAENKSLPIAITIGTNPIITFAASTRVPEGCEMNYAAEIMHKDIELYRCPNGICVPDSEIVLYGELTSTLHEEGPFVDISGTYDGVRQQPTIELKGMYLKEDFIYHAIVPSGAEHKMLMGVPYEPRIFKEAEKYADVKDVLLTPGGSGYFHAVIQIHKKSEDDAKNVISAAFKAHGSLKHVIAVDDDIDIYNPEDIEFAIATRVRADTDLIILTGVRGSSLDPRRTKDGLNVKAGVDATIPLGREKEFIRAKWN